MSWIVVIVVVNVVFAFVPKIIRRFGHHYYNYYDCRFILHQVPRDGRYEGPPPSEWPIELRRKAYWPKRYGQFDWPDPKDLH